MRLVKGAKETFGWVIVGEGRELLIPPAAWERYGFQAGDEAIFTPGSRKSGGFGLTNRRLLERSALPLGESRSLGYGRFDADRQVRLPQSIPIDPGDRLLTVFGSGYALGFISRGPIFEEACRHPELDEFKQERS
ncbi:MAG: hypothetical protein JXA78_02065 [Anaerolineales bacterium]|nr:hypothetical protein [Anaerolineales bacterium]